MTQDRNPKTDKAHRSRNASLLLLAKSESLGAGDLDTSLSLITEVAADTLQTERASVWFYDECRRKLLCLDLFEMSTRSHSRGIELAAENVPAYFRALEEERTVAAHDARSDPRTREFTDSYLVPLGITAMLDAPIRLGTRILGVVCHEHVGSSRRWSEDEQAFAGSIADLVSVAFEADERRKAQAEVGRSERHFRSLIENALDIIAVVDGKGIIRYVSPSVEKTLGFRMAAFLGRPYLEFVHPKDLATVRKIRRYVFAHPGLPTTSDLRLSHSNGDWRVFECVGRNLLDDDSVSGIVLNFRDISERKAAEKVLADYRRSLELEVKERTAALSGKNSELQEALRKLRETQNQLIIHEKLASLGRLVAGIAHEVNNPIGVVNSAADLSDRCLNKLLSLLDSAVDLVQLRNAVQFQQLLNLLRENNQVTASAVSRVSDIVRNLKNFARLDEAEFQAADLHEGLESTLTLIQHEIKNNVRVVKDYGDLPLVFCYPNQLNQVFMNLLLNAAEAIEREGEIRIQTRAEDSHVRVRISDTGRGIDSRHLSKIFDPGFTTRGVSYGTGMGLSLCYKIIESHRGEISVKSSPGSGTEFTIRLPVKQGAP